MRLLVAGEFSWFSGSSHVIREYVDAGATLGLEVAVWTGAGSRDETIQHKLPFRDELSWATHLLIVYEGHPFLSAEQIDRIDSVIPRSRRAVIDADGHFAPYTPVGDDDNAWPCGSEAWRQHISAISDLVLQPSLAGPNPGATPFPYFGMPPVESEPRRSHSSRIDVQYVGNNWFRVDSLSEVFSAARTALGTNGTLRVCGKGWDGSSLPGLESATYADPAALRALGIEARPPVPFGHVAESMGDALISPVLMRPVLS